MSAELDRIEREWIPVIVRLKARYGDAEVERRWLNFRRQVEDAAEIPAVIFEAGWRHWR